MDFRIRTKRLGLFTFLYGLLETSIGAAGPMLAVGSLQYGKRKQKFVAFNAAMFFTSALFKSVGYLSMGFSDTSLITLASILIVAAVVRTYIGKHLLEILPEKIFEHAVVALMIIIAIKGLFF